MRFENIFQFIVPLTFFAIWALTSLFNREAQPLPPRSGRPPGPNGPRPTPTASPDAPRPVERGADRSQRDPTMRWTKPSAPDRPPVRRPPAMEDVGNDVLRIPAEPARRPPPQKAVSGPEPRRAARSRPAPSAPPKRTEPTRPEPSQASALSRSMEHDIALPVNRRLVLDSMPESLAAATATDMGLSAPLPERAASPAPLAGNDLGLLLASPSKLHQAIILNELFQPPLALRSTARRRP